MSEGRWPLDLIFGMQCLLACSFWLYRSRCGCRHGMCGSSRGWSSERLLVGDCPQVLGLHLANEFDGVEISDSA